MEAVTIKTMLQEHWEQVKQIYESGIAQALPLLKPLHPIGRNGMMDI
jgi:hypothetical protein